jgi:hypothetical protein
MAANRFSVQYGIMMPNGDIYSHPKQQSSPWASLFGGTEPTEPEKPVPPATFASREDAEAALKKLAEQAATVGVSNWGGTVVQRFCTPFTNGDPAAQFAAAVSEWLEKHDG